MALLDFPNNPVLDEIFDGTNGARYRYDGTLWQGFGSGSGSGGVVPPASGITSVIHDASMSGDGTGATPLAVDLTWVNTQISNAIIDAQGFVRSGEAAPMNQPSMDEALARINTLEREAAQNRTGVAALREKRLARANKPPSPLERAASRSRRRLPPTNQGA